LFWLFLFLDLWCWLGSFWLGIFLCSLSWLGSRLGILLLLLLLGDSLDLHLPFSELVLTGLEILKLIGGDGPVLVQALLVFLLDQGSLGSLFLSFVLGLDAGGGILSTLSSELSDFKSFLM